MIWASGWEVTVAKRHADRMGVRRLADAVALTEESRRRVRRRRTGAGAAFVVVASVVVIGNLGREPAAGTRSHRADSVRAPAACSRARVALLGVTPMSGAAVSDGLLVRAAVSSPTVCAVSGYPTLRAELSDHATARARDMRLGYLGGYSGRGRLARLSITPRPRELSFTVQFVTGNGPTCPRLDAIEFALPGSRVLFVTRTIYRAGRYAEPAPLIDCGQLVVTPLVTGSSGRQ